MNAAIYLMLALFAPPAAAQDRYPSKPVTVIVPQAAGGANDGMARILMQKISASTGAQFVIDNRPGAGGNIGVGAATRAAKDGYTLLFAGTPFVINPALFKNPQYDPIRDFTPVARMVTVGYVLAANPSFPASNVRELISMAKAKPGTIAYASSGNGTINHLLGEMLKSDAGIDLVHVPYKGASASATDLLGGRIPLGVQSVPSVAPLLASGKLKALGVMGEKRISTLPGVPAIGETLPGFGATQWYGVFAPAGTPPQVVARLEVETRKALEAKDLQEKMAANGAEPAFLGAEEFTGLIKLEIPKWARIVKSSGAHID